MRTKDNRHIDELFRKSLVNHEIQPSEGSWQKLNDSIIRDKFSSLEVQPSNEAWERLNSRLNKENNTSIKRVLMIAASLSIILLVGYLLINNQIETPTQEIAFSVLKKDMDPVSDEVVSENVVAQNQSTTAKMDETKSLTQQVAATKEVTTNKSDITNNQPEVIVLTGADNSIIKSITKVEVSYTTGLPNLTLDKGITNKEYNELDISISKLSFRDKLKNTWQGIRNLRDSEEKLIDLPKAKNDLFAKASKGLQNSFQKLKINRNNDEETDD